jgi:hypothetical protein
LRPFLPAEAVARRFWTVDPLPNVAISWEMEPMADIIPEMGNLIRYEKRGAGKSADERSPEIYSGFLNI